MAEITKVTQAAVASFGGPLGNPSNTAPLPQVDISAIRFAERATPNTSRGVDCCDSVALLVAASDYNDGINCQAWFDWSKQKFPTPILPPPFDKMPSWQRWKVEMRCRLVTLTNFCNRQFTTDPTQFTAEAFVFTYLLGGGRDDLTGIPLRFTDGKSICGGAFGNPRHGQPMGIALGQKHEQTGEYALGPQQQALLSESKSVNFLKSNFKPEKLNSFLGNVFLSAFISPNSQNKKWFARFSGEEWCEDFSSIIDSLGLSAKEIGNHFRKGNYFPTA
ncbi:hypothetical protein T439DRAFT_322240, partial [Meredithblackwellia eburnea MCA 4105]